MTIAVAFMCNGGIIIGADSELSYVDLIKIRTGKLRFFFSPEIGIIGLTGAGSWDYVEMAMQKILARCGACPPKTVEEYRQHVEDTVLEIYEKHIHLYPGEQKPQFLLLIAVIDSHKCQGLIKSVDTAITSPIPGYGIVGIGDLLGNYLVDKMYRAYDFSIREGAILAAYILWVTKRYAPGCGGSSTIFLMTAPRSLFCLDKIQIAEERFEKWDALIRALFFPALDTRVSSEDFAEGLKGFNQIVLDFKDEWQAVPILEPATPGTFTKIGE